MTARSRCWATNSSLRNGRTTMNKSLTLLDDDQVISFIVQGYILLQPEYSPGLNETVCRQLNETGGAPVNLRDDPHGQALLRQAPALNDVFTHPEVEGA